MKKLYFLLLLISGFSSAQIVNIPDANFKAKLLNASSSNNTASNLYPAGGNYINIDVNDDGEIQVSEALNVYSLNLTGSNISDLTGIEQFTNLRELKSGNNTIISLDLNMLTNLIRLDLRNNNLLTLDVSELTNLTYLNCEMNNLTTLDISALPSLMELWCTSNNLTTLISSPINSLTDLNCSQNNFTTLDLSMFTNLNYLNCSFNQLTILDFSMLTNLTSLYCHENQLTSLDVSALINLTLLMCSYNQLTILDVSALPNLTELRCHYNNLITLNMKNGSNETTLNFSNNPNLLYVCADVNQLIAVQNDIVVNGYLNCHVNTYCSFTPGGDYNTITGNVKLDSNQNGCDSNDYNFPYIRLNISDQNIQVAGFTNDLGNYIFYTEIGDFTLTPAIENSSWFTFSPSTANVVFADDNNNTTTQNFCITANGVHPDLEIVISPVMPARPGFDAVYKIVYRNKGNQILSQQYGINFFYNQNLMDFVSTSVATSSLGTGSLSWDYVDLQPFESRFILVTFNINAPTDSNPVNIADILTFTTSILPQSGDENTSDNLFVFNQMVVGSYDPNDVTCLEGDIVAPSEIGDYLHYMIRFENTGTAAAENIVVRTVVNLADFDVNTLQLLNASHAVDARINGNVVEFIFQNILLESGGHGNVLLKVKSKSNLQQGDNVNKRANIYFDYNYPVETNDFETIFQSLSSPYFETDNTISIYPNPSNGIVNVSGDFNIKSIQLFDMQGRLLQTNIVNENNTTIDIATQSVGVYFIRVVSDKGMKVEKLVKQ